jgi:hypothetical protein
VTPPDDDPLAHALTDLVRGEIADVAEAIARARASGAPEADVDAWLAEGVLGPLRAAGLPDETVQSVLDEIREAARVAYRGMTTWWN